jgi:FK506-binding protein 1
MKGELQPESRPRHRKTTHRLRYVETVNERRKVWQRYVRTRFQILPSLSPSSPLQRRDVIVEIFAAGDGINYPRKGNTVTVHYTGYLADGTRFDSSRDRNKPFKFKLGMEQVIPGLDLGVAQLSIGERAKMTIPPHLAYGERGFPGL